MLNCLAQRPGRSLTLSDLARETGISKSTLHPLAETLLNSGYLLRDSDRRLHLGPALTGLGEAALGERGHLVSSLRALMNEIADELNAHCILTAQLGEWVVPLAAAGEPSRVTTLFRVGERTQPFAPPLGVLFLFGRSMGELQEWLGRAYPEPDSREVDMVMAALELLRSRGVAAAARSGTKALAEGMIFRENRKHSETPDPESFQEWMTELRREQYLIVDFSDPTPREVEWIGTPLLNRAGRVDLALCAVNFPKPLSGEEVLEIGGYLRTRAASVPGVRLT
ncbi:helix-turn-helix domain-containing protein [Rhodococcus oxybenzonivorans]|uniref:helix-turn-helix domain-containing protein n=1 Tax=Rhodococcus oxybenzonivorans TaxID=1990687 RepID=UPI0029536E53|nr:helix-turn-helix domain-containing protein [Rhodococcus oxybenzonivorans]MDV7333428.1 helix-turn-helix domain-containing protein [Rhodococcus oxybenzonivorans]